MLNFKNMNNNQVIKSWSKYSKNEADKFGEDGDYFFAFLVVSSVSRLKRLESRDPSQLAT